MVYVKEFEITTTDKNSLHNITDVVEKTINESGIKNGVVVVETLHSTAGILMITSYGKEILDDVIREMRRTIPSRINFYHQQAPENAAGHVKSSLFGTSVSAIVKDAKLLCTNKKDIYFADYDGPQNRKYSICVIGE